MQIPLYDTHFYIGFPVLLWLAYDSYKRYKNNQNVSALYIALASLFLSFSMLTWGFPALFSSDPKLLSYFTFIGDSCQTISFLFLWLLSIRAFMGSKPLLKNIAYFTLISLVMVGILDAMRRNLNPPYSTNLNMVSGIPDIVFTAAPSYNILTGIFSISLFLLSFYFWKQAGKAPSKSKILRIRSLAIVFLLTSLVNALMPGILLPGKFDIKDALLTIIFLMISISAMASNLLNKRSRSS